MKLIARQEVAAVGEEQSEKILETQILSDLESTGLRDLAHEKQEGRNQG